MCAKISIRGEKPQNDHALFLNDHVPFPHLRGSVLNITSDFFLKMLLIDHKNHMLKWLGCGVGPFLSRAEFVFTHLKIDEIDCQET